MEIVGVVRNMGMAMEPAPLTAGAYLPLHLSDVSTVSIAARVAGDMTAATNAFRATVAKADPTLRVSDVQPLSLPLAAPVTTAICGPPSLARNLPRSGTRRRIARDRSFDAPTSSLWLAVGLLRTFDWCWSGLP
jgi:hypothetical protein